MYSAHFHNVKLMVIVFNTEIYLKSDLRCLIELDTDTRKEINELNNLNKYI